MMQVNGRPALFQRWNDHPPRVPLRRGDTPHIPDPGMHIAQQETLSFSVAWRLDADVTVGRAMAAANQRLRNSQSETPRLDVEILLSHVLDADRASLYAHPERHLTASERARFEELIERRRRHEPVAYLINSRAFYGLDFYITPDVLVPRPETELLVEHTILAAETLAGRAVLAPASAPRPVSSNGHGPGPFPPYAQLFRSTAPRAGVQLADIGAGSGAVAISLAHHLPDAMIFATDISAAALAVARRNAHRLQVAQRIEFLQGHLLDALSHPVDIITANLPYIPSADIADLAPDIANFEPRLALDGGPDGLRLIGQLLSQAPGRLRVGGMVLLEIGSDQGFLVMEMAHRAFPAAEVKIIQDFAGLDRVVRIQCP